MTATAPQVKPFDIVFDSQATFRIVLDAMARPGSIGLLTALDQRCPLPDYRPLTAVARTLLDHEVTFAVVAGTSLEEATALSHYLAAATGSRSASPAEADYVITDGPLERGLLTCLKRGTLTFPDESATLIVLIPDFATADDTLTVTLTGPGIPGTLATRLPGFSAENLSERRVANAEVPRGVDLLLVDPTGRVMCLPRTTKVGVG
jgi:alpha-D-ribose 1-methylphosphonate 5-triphosphate synthase subunit PhnH